MGWLTGERHKPTDNQKFNVTVHFNHDCLKHNPKHKVCFPVVGACGKEITFPVAHMSPFGEFKELFILPIVKAKHLLNLNSLDHIVIRGQLPVDVIVLLLFSDS